jgi:hypothetical protein
LIKNINSIVNLDTEYPIFQVGTERPFTRSRGAHLRLECSPPMYKVRVGHLNLKTLERIYTPRAQTAWHLKPEWATVVPEARAFAPELNRINLRHVYIRPEYHLKNNVGSF